MNDLVPVGRLLIGVGLVLVIVGGLVLLGGRLPGLAWLGRLPGDIVVRRGPVTVYVPIVTSLVLSLILTIALGLFVRR